jgi:hypothetical protein
MAVKHELEQELEIQGCQLRWGGKNNMSKDV